MTEFKAGDRIQHAYSTGTAHGTVVEVMRSGKCLVVFDDQGSSKWLLRPTSLQHAQEQR